jgi:hypothetical protein
MSTNHLLSERTLAEPHHKALGKKAAQGVCNKLNSGNAKDTPRQ